MNEVFFQDPNTLTPLINLPLIEVPEEKPFRPCIYRSEERNQYEKWDCSCPRFRPPVSGVDQGICEICILAVGPTFLPPQPKTEKKSLKLVDHIPFDSPPEKYIDCSYRGSERLDESGKHITVECKSGCAKGTRLKTYLCQHPCKDGEVITFADCDSCCYRPRRLQENVRKIILWNRFSPGDILVMSAAIRSLHLQHPGLFRIMVDSPCSHIWENSPDVEEFPEEEREKIPKIRVDYDMINRSNQEPIHFMQAFAQEITQKLQAPFRLLVNRPYLYLSKKEKEWLPQVEEVTQKKRNYWVLNAGYKKDATTKSWGRVNYQELVDRLRGEVLFVQIGDKNHHHPHLDGVIDFRGKTDIRQLIRLCYHSMGGVGPTTFLQHVMAALEKPYMCILGAREPVSWVNYPKQQTFHVIGSLECGSRACWKSRTVPLGDQDVSDSSLCEQPFYGFDPIPKCMAMIKPEFVASVLSQYNSNLK